MVYTDTVNMYGVQCTPYTLYIEKTVFAEHSSTLPSNKASFYPHLITDENMASALCVSFKCAGQSTFS